MDESQIGTDEWWAWVEDVTRRHLAKDNPEWSAEERIADMRSWSRSLYPYSESLQRRLLTPLHHQMIETERNLNAR